MDLMSPLAAAKNNADLLNRSLIETLSFRCRRIEMISGRSYRAASRRGVLLERFVVKLTSATFVSSSGVWILQGKAHP